MITMVGIDDKRNIKNHFRENLQIYEFRIFSQTQHLWKINFTDIRLIF